MTPDISVVIPCRGPCSTLDRLLASLAGQSLDAERFEVILVDDGSDPPLAITEGDGPDIRLTLLRQERLGPAAARNAALRTARSDLILFLNADAEADRELLAGHVREHAGADQACAVVGRFDFSSDSLNLVTRLCDSAGLLFPHATLEQDLRESRPPSYETFCTGNLSVPKRLVLEAGGFAETFVWPIFEDVELGYRLMSGGLQLRFGDQLRCAHHHTFDVQGVQLRFWRYGHDWVRFCLTHPGWDPSGARVLFWRDDEWDVFALAHPVAAATGDPAAVAKSLRPTARLAEEVSERLRALMAERDAALNDIEDAIREFGSRCLLDFDSVRPDFQANGPRWTQSLCRISRYSWLSGVLEGIVRLVPREDR